MSEKEPQLTQEQAKALYESNSNRLRIQFASYYKFTFIFIGETDEMEVQLSYGGNSDDIYRYDVTNSPAAAPSSFDLLMSEYTSVTIKDKKTGLEFYSYND